MSDVSEKEVIEAVGEKQALASDKHAGHDLHFSDPKVEGNKVTYTIDTKSLDGFMEKHGLPKTAGKAAPGEKTAEKMQSRGDDKYAAEMMKGGKQRQNDIARSLSTGPTYSPRNKNFAALREPTPSTSAKAPLMRVHNRHMLKLRQTIKELMSAKREVVFDPKTLRKETHARLAKEAVDYGKDTTAAGSLDETLRLAGEHPDMTPDSALSKKLAEQAIANGMNMKPVTGLDKKIVQELAKKPQPSNFHGPTWDKWRGALIGVELDGPTLKRR